MKVEILSLDDSKKSDYGTSFIVDDKILVNIPEFMGENPAETIENLNLLLISEFSPEYVSGIVQFFERIAERQNKVKLTVVAPKNFLQKFLQYCSIHDLDLTPQQVSSVLNIVEVDKITSLTVDGLSVHALTSADDKRLFFVILDKAEKIVGFLCGFFGEEELEVYANKCSKLFLGGSNLKKNRTTGKNLLVRPGIYKI